MPAKRSKINTTCTSLVQHILRLWSLSLNTINIGKSCIPNIVKAGACNENMIFIFNSIFTQGTIIMHYYIYMDWMAFICWFLLNNIIPTLEISLGVDFSVLLLPQIIFIRSWILNVCVWRPLEWHLITLQHGPMTTLTCWTPLYFKILQL
jgi:hypothetical protein